MKCRSCKKDIKNIFADLKTCPPSNHMVEESELNDHEIYFPLKVFVCDNCWLVQANEIKNPSYIFNDKYTYFSSISKSWLDHCKIYSNKIIKRFKLNINSNVLEIASNDGYLLQYFYKAKIPVLGIEPSSNTAKIAQDKGIECIIDFFSSRLAKKSLKNYADIIIGNNVLAHVPDINDFLKGIKIALKDDGVCIFEFPHLLSLIKYNQFDTIYHEHYSYLSLIFLKKALKKIGLVIFDVEKINTHGGSLRVFIKNQHNKKNKISNKVMISLNQEKKFGIDNLNLYKNFQNKIDEISNSLLKFLIQNKLNNKKVIGYGAAAKGNTLLNYCGIKGNTYIEYVVDKSPIKQKKFLPGSRILVESESKIRKSKPDFIIIFPWNIKKEIIDQLSYVREWKCKFVTFIPKLKIN